MNRPPSVAASYRHVRRISRRSGSNFYRSFWLLPRPKRRAMCALYAFARITDDLGDCDAAAVTRSIWLDWWRRATEANMSEGMPIDQVILPVEVLPTISSKRLPVNLQRSANQVFPALRDASMRYRIPSRYLLEIIDGVTADQQKTRFDTYEQLEHYCYLVASSVGLACLHIWEYEDPLPTAAAIDCGLAFQLTNILRDISEDAQRGRIYLPRQHYEQHGLSEDDLLMPRPDDRLRCLVDDEVRRAERLFESGWEVWDSLHPDGRPMFSMMWRRYRKLLAKIAAAPGSVLQRRVGLSNREKFDLVSRHFIKPMFRRLPSPPSELLSNDETRR
ncbi:phytoene/squalene synthase family protein [Rubripirellula reticaptiva]|nr:phytoene/squalene synthase family protein [Rubripirellula reticaptiva]